MSEIQLPPELERFATELLRAVRDAEAEADRDGCYSIEEVEADMRAAVKHGATLSH